MAGEVIIEEYHGRKASKRVRLQDGAYKAQNLSTAAGTVSSSIAAALLPEGYPNSVTSDYLSEHSTPSQTHLALFASFQRP